MSYSPAAYLVKLAPHGQGVLAHVHLFAILMVDLSIEALVLAAVLPLGGRHPGGDDVFAPLGLLLGDVQVVEQFPLVETLLQQAVAVARGHLGHRPVALGRRDVGPLDQTAYTSHDATGRGQGKGGVEVATEPLAGITGQG